MGNYWLKRAAIDGYAEAEYDLACVTCMGRGIGQDEQQAVKWLNSAASHGHDLAEFVLGLLYSKGIAVPQNFFPWRYSGTGKLPIKAMRPRPITSPYCLSLLPQLGGNPAEIVRLYTSAAAKGIAEAESNLAGLYEIGFGVSKNQNRSNELVLQSGAGWK